jgi:hypothetical protein
MQAIHGGTANNDNIDAPQLAVLLRGGMRPQASVSPATLRATRELLPRRRPLRRTRAALLTHIPQTNRQDNLPAIGQTLADTAPRDGVAERCAAPAGQQSLAGDLAWSRPDAHRLPEGALPRVHPAQHHAAPPGDRRPAVPGIGPFVRLGILYASQASARCPHRQECVSSGRLGTCAQASAGKRAGPSGTKIGKAYVPWAGSAAAVLCLRDKPAAQHDVARREQQHGPGQACTILAQPWARAVSDR